MKRIASLRRGFAHLGVMVLLVAIAGLATTVFVVQNNTEFGGSAYKRASFVGVVEKVSPCVNGNLCFKLTQTEDGVEHYLISRKIISLLPDFCSGPVSFGCGRKSRIGSNVDLSKYVGKRVRAYGQLITTVNPNFVYVLSVDMGTPSTGSQGGKKKQSTLPVTEIGTVVKVEVQPVESQTQGSSGASAAGPAMSWTVTSNTVSPSTCLRDSSGKPVCPEREPVECPSGSRLVQPEMADVCGCTVPPTCVPPGKCIPRPACLDAKPHACLIAEPEEGWCPPTTPPPPPTRQPKYVLKTADGRFYPLFMSDTSLVSGYVGKTVLVEGTMTMKEGAPTGRPCILIYPPPPGCVGGEWWPLPGGLDFEVKKVQLANKTGTYKWVGALSRAESMFAGENVYLLSETSGAGKKYYVRSSFADLSGFVNSGEVVITGDSYAVGTLGTVIVNAKTVAKLNQGSGTHPISWVTDSGDVTLSADDFYVEVNGRKFVGNSQNLSLHSDSVKNGHPDYTTLEATWKEDGTEMRIYMYFYKDSTKWWTSEIRTYDGKNPGDWVYFPSNEYATLPKATMGQEFYGGNYFLHHTGSNFEDQVTLNFNNLRLKAFAKGSTSSGNNPCRNDNDCRKKCNGDKRCIMLNAVSYCDSGICRYGDADR